METIFLVFALIQLTVGVSGLNIIHHDSLLPDKISTHGRHKGTSDKLHIFEEYISKLMSFPYPFRKNTTCHIHSTIVTQKAKELNVFALKMVDATAKLSSGILSGNLNQYGDFDECLNTNIYNGNNNINGKYCLVTISLKLKNSTANLKLIDDLIHSYRMFTNDINDSGHRIPKLETFNWGVCIPHSCTHSDLQQALRLHLNHVFGTNWLKTDVIVNENMCFEKGGTEFKKTNIAVLIFFLIIILIVCCGTYVDNHKLNTKVRRKDGLIKYLLCFSLKRNLSILFKADHSQGDIQLIHGVRFLNAIALLLSHKQMALMFHPIINRTAMSKSLGKPWSMIGRSAILYTDSFILISGLLFSYSVIGELDTKRKINYRERLMTRLVRLTPNLFALIMFCTFLMEYTGSGPQWGLVVKQYADLCKRNMWQNFLYIHNYFGFETMCLTHTHQLGIDMQLFLISPFLIYILWKSTKKGFFLFAVLGLASTYLRYYITLRERLSTLIYFGISVDRLWRTATLSYILPTHRLTVYLAGLALGYYLRRNGRRIQLAYYVRLMGWIAAVSSGLLAMFGPYHVSSINYTYNVKDSALYNAFSPILWLLFLSWAILACENGWGGWFHDFLSWKYFTIFTRISYALYLTQFPVFFYNVGTQRSAYFYRGFHSIIDLPEILLIFLLSIVMTLLFDLPFQNMRKTFLNMTNGSQPKKESISESLKQDINVRRQIKCWAD